MDRINNVPNEILIDHIIFKLPSQSGAQRPMYSIQDGASCFNKLKPS